MQIIPITFSFIRTLTNRNKSTKKKMQTIPIDFELHITITNKNKSVTKKMYASNAIDFAFTI